MQFNKFYNNENNYNLSSVNHMTHKPLFRSQETVNELYVNQKKENKKL